MTWGAAVAAGVAVAALAPYRSAGVADVDGRSGFESRGVGVEDNPLAAAVAAFTCSGVTAASCEETGVAAGGVVVIGGTSTGGATPAAKLVAAAASVEGA